MFSPTFQALTSLSSVLSFSSLSVRWGKLEPEPAQFSPRLPEPDIFFDLVVQISHVLSGVAQPILALAVAASGAIPSVRIPKSTKRGISGFVRACMRRVDVASLQ